MTSLNKDVIEAFRSTLRGPLLLPDDPGYDQARSIWNAMIDRRPALIVRCAGVADVMASVNFAREQELLLATTEDHSVLPALARVARHPVPQVRREVPDAMGAAGGDDAVPFLVGIGLGADPELRRRAVAVLAGDRDGPGEADLPERSDDAGRHAVVLGDHALDVVVRGRQAGGHHVPGVLGVPVVVVVLAPLRDLDPREPG